MDQKGLALRKFAVAFGFMLLAVVMSWQGALDRTSSKYEDEALVQAFSAYTVVRGVNDVVSLLQSVLVRGSLGASFEISPVEALDPINDLVERYALVMEFSIASLLTQKILIGIPYIRKAMVEAEEVEVMVALSGQLFFSTQIPACLWFLAKQKTARPCKMMIIDARQLGTNFSRMQIELTDADIERIAHTVANWRGESLCVSGEIAEYHASPASAVASNWLKSPSKAMC